MSGFRLHKLGSPRGFGTGIARVESAPSHGFCKLCVKEKGDKAMRRVLKYDPVFNTKWCQAHFNKIHTESRVKTFTPSPLKWSIQNDCRRRQRARIKGAKRRQVVKKALDVIWGAPKDGRRSMDA